MIKIPTPKYLALFFFLSALSPAWAQKVKYKDIYALLSTKQYEQAEPFLQQYLDAEKKPIPNAFLFRALIYAERAGKVDVLKQREQGLALVDSALIYFDRARNTIDEKEIRRNKDYYQIYSRRDLRTGEFGIKLSDIQLDIDKRTEMLRARSTGIISTTAFFARADSLYRGSQALFASLRERYATLRELYLRADEAAIADLTKLSLRFDSCANAFERYRGASATVGNFSYRQEFLPVEIKDYEREGLTPADFFEDQPSVWDYKTFADRALSVISNDIVPMRKHLVAYDIEINKLREKLDTDSVSVRSDLTRIIDKLLYDQLKKYDPRPLPLELFNVKIAHLEYRSLLIEHLPLRDSVHAHLQMELASKEQATLNRLDSALSRVNGADLQQRARDYQYFVNETYGQPSVLVSFVSTLTDQIGREREEMQARVDLATEGLRWIVDGNDSIPLYNPVDGNPYKMLFTDDKLTTGLHFADSLRPTGYFYTIVPSLRPEVSVRFPVDKSGFRQGQLSQTKALANTDAGGQIFLVLVYSEVPAQAKYRATLAKIYRSDGLSWANPFNLGFIPNGLFVNSGTGEITIQGETESILIDKNGKLMK